jgi:Flp pilus assembly protein TadG
MRFISFKRRIAGLLRHEKGLAAIEFAMVLPVMLVMFMGTVELSNLLTADRRTEAVAATLTDLVARDDSITQAEVTDIFYAAQSVMADMYSSTLQMVITSINESSGKAVVGWSRAKNAAADSKGSTVNDVPSGLLTTGGSVIRVRVTYPYSLTTLGTSNYKQSNSGPIMAYDLGADHTIKKTFYLRPRLVQQLAEPS